MGRFFNTFPGGTLPQVARSRGFSLSQDEKGKGPVLRCAIPAPLRQCLDYRAPADWHRPIARGARVQAPLGSRTLTGIITATVDGSSVAPGKLKSVSSVLDESPLIDKRMMDLLCWTADYYQHPPGETLLLGLSVRERRGQAPANIDQPGFELSVRGKGLAEDSLTRAPRQRALVATLREGPKSRAELLAAGFTGANLRSLAARELIKPVSMQTVSEWRSQPSLEPNPEQAEAITAICASAGQFSCHLLEGVTGSGKTEVYLQCISQMLARGRQCLVLVPEIGLTPQLLRRFEERFDAPIAVLHSGLGNAERDRNWQRARLGDAAIILGTRSAVFTPMLNPGLIVVDEEHDLSLSQQDGLRYSARDVAVKRAQLSDCPVVLGSATPSLESMANATSKRYHWHQLTRRATGAQPPRKHIVDIRGLELNAGLSATLETSISDALNAGEQVLLFLNRRGFAPALRCHDCGWVAECGHCDARETLHRKPPRLQCHHCGAREAVPEYCPGCRGRRLFATGLGTEQTELALRANYPEVPVYRVDSDSMSGRQAMSSFTEEVAKGGPCIMLGTQLLAKGHHFPRVTRVGVLDADAMLFSPDFRGEERLAQLLTQVAGRAGRAQRPGEVLIQTRHPDHPIIAAVLDTDWTTLSEQLLAARRQQGLPPHGALAALRCDSPDANAGLLFLQQLAEQPGADRAPSGVRIVGPLAAPMARRAGLYRSHLIVAGGSRGAVQAAMKELVVAAGEQRAPTGLRWFVDIDPSEPL